MNQLNKSLKVKWITLENEMGTGSLKQHGFIPDVAFRRHVGGEYTGNISLCGRVWAGNGNEEVEYFDKLEGEIPHSDACKQCLAKFNKTTFLV